MKASVWKLVVIVTGLMLSFGCEVTEEKIELWKGTKNGPKKLAGTAIDKDVPPPLRAKAILALVEIQDRDDEDVWNLFTKTFEKMHKADAENVLNLAIPELAKKVDGESKDPINKAQVGAKDALYVMIDYAGGEGKVTAEKALLRWCTTDYNSRALAGKYNIRAIVKKIGPPAADALITLLNFDEIAIKFIAELIRDVNDETVLTKASSKLAEELKTNVNKLQEVHLITAAIIGRDPIAQTLLTFAGNKDLTPELQRYSLRAFSEGLARKTIKINEQLMTSLFEIAENTRLDQHQREETYYVIAQVGRDGDRERIAKLLKSQDPFWRAIGLRCLLRTDEKGDQLDALLTELDQLKLSKNTEDVDEAVQRIASFPQMLPAVRKLISSSSVFAAAVAAGVLEKIGSSDDIKILEPLKKESKRLPSGFKYKTLSEAAETAIESIQERG